MRWRFRISWPDLPLFLAAALLLVGSVMLIANLVLGAVAHGRTMKLVPGLFGVVVKPQLDLTVRNLADGRFESEFARYVGPREPFYPFAVRLTNQLQYSLFGASPLARVVLGRDRELLERAYLLDYCGRDVPAFLATAPAWAGKIRQMQDLARRRGRLFLYVITPSKVAQYPAFLPAHWPCPAPEADRVGLVPAWVRVARAAGINTADTTAALWAAHPRYPFNLYPQGGTHWNEVGWAVGAQAVLAALRGLSPDPHFAPFSMGWRMSDDPGGTDIDLADLMNLMWPLVHFSVPHTAISAPPPPVCRPLRITIVGGSFMMGIGQVLSRLPCPATVVEYEYWSIYHIAFHCGKATPEGVDPAQRDRDLNDADVIIYEENEQLLGQSRHGPLLYQWLVAHWG